MGSSWTRIRTHVPRIGRRILKTTGSPRKSTRGLFWVIGLRVIYFAFLKFFNISFDYIIFNWDKWKNNFLAAAVAKVLQSYLTLQPHRQQPTRLLCPWNSLGKNTGVGCHFLLQCMKVKSESEVSQLCPTLSDPMDCSLPGSSIHAIFQARVLEWLPLPSPNFLSTSWENDECSVSWFIIEVSCLWTLGLEVFIPSCRDRQITLFVLYSFGDLLILFSFKIMVLFYISCFMYVYIYKYQTCQ